MQCSLSVAADCSSLPGAWTSASLPNHLLFFPHPAPLSGDPLPRPLCTWPAAQLFPGWWFGPGRPVFTILTPAQCPPPVGQPLASIRNYLPPALQFKGRGGLLIQFLLALPQPLPSMLEHSPLLPPLLPWAGRWTVHGSLPEAG